MNKQACKQHLMYCVREMFKTLLLYFKISIEEMFCNLKRDFFIPILIVMIILMGIFGWYLKGNNSVPGKVQEKKVPIKASMIENGLDIRHLEYFKLKYNV